jgi:hypothetical protein
MGSNIPLPALLSKPPEQPDPLGGIQRILAIKSLLGQEKTQQQEQTLRDQQIQQGQLSLQDHQAQTKAMQAWDGKDYNGRVEDWRGVPKV